MRVVTYLGHPSCRYLTTASTLLQASILFPNQSNINIINNTQMQHYSPEGIGTMWQYAWYDVSFFSLFFFFRFTHAKVLMRYLRYTVHTGNHQHQKSEILKYINRSLCFRSRLVCIQFELLNLLALYVPQPFYITSKSNLLY